YHPDIPSELAEPNNILGISYLAALRKTKSPIRPFTVRREKAGYHQRELTDHHIASATAIRRQWLESGDVNAIEPFVPPTTFLLLKDRTEKGIPPLTWESFHPMLFAKLM